MATVLIDLSVLRTETRVRGIGRYVADLSRAFARHVSEPRLLGIERLDWDGSAQVSDDIPGALDRLHESPRESHLAWAYRLRVALARATRRIGPDLLHTGHPNATPLGRFVCPRIVTCHDLIPLRYPEQYLDARDGYRAGRERLDYRRYHLADHIIAVSESTANDLMTLLGISSKKITVVYNGVDLSRWSHEATSADPSTRDRHGLADRNYLLYVGAADWRKNADGMLAALALVRKRRPSAEVTLAWAAELDRESRRRVLARAKDLGLSSAVLLLGYVPDTELAALYRGAVAQLFVSRSEGFGYPLVEAMSAGCPVVTSDRSSTAEIASDAALQVSPDDPEAIAAALVHLLDDTSERRRMARLGIARARHFSLERMAENTRDVYRDVISGLK